MYDIHSKDINGILAGCILGDGSLKNNPPTGIEMRHGDAQRDYVLFKYNYFSSLGLRCSKRIAFMGKSTIGDFYYSQVNVNGIRGMPALHASKVDLVRMINPIGLLFWWLDDGSLSVQTKQSGSVSRYGHISTHALSYEEHELVAAILEQRFGIETRIHKDVSGKNNPISKKDFYYRLYLNATNMRRLIDILRPYIHYVPETMLYKFHMGYVVNRLKDSHVFAELYNFQHFR